MNTYRNSRILKALAGILLLVVTAWAIVVYAPVESVLSQWLERRIGRLLDAEVTIKGLDVNFSGAMRAGQVTIRPGSLLDERIVLADVSVELAPFSLLTGEPRAARMVVGNIKMRLTPDLIQWASQKTDQAAAIRGAFPELLVDSGEIDLDLPGFFPRLRLTPFKLGRFRFYAAEDGDGYISGGISFAAGENNDVTLRFKAFQDQGFIETDIEANGFDLSWIPPTRVAGHDIDFSTTRFRGALSGTVTYLTSSRQFVGDLALTGLTAGHPATGLVVQGGSAKVQLSNGELLVHRGDFHALGGRVAIPLLKLGFGAEGVHGFDMDADAKGMALPLLEELGLLEFLPEQFHPARLDSGVLDASVTGRWRPADGFEYRVGAAIKDAAGVLKYPEAAFSGLTGVASIESSGTMTVEHASARFWNGDAAVYGSLEIFGEELENPDLHIHFRQIRLNDTLMGVLPDLVREGILYAGPSGVIGSGHIRLSESETWIDLDLHVDELAPHALPVAFEKVGGTIKWSADAPLVRFESVSGSTDGSPVQGHGSILVKTDDLEADFTVSGKDIRLGEEILDWFNIDTGEWDVVGRFDLELKAADWFPVTGSVVESFAGIESSISLHNVTVSHPDHGRLGRSISGKLVQGPGGIDLERFEGEFFGIAASGEGSFPFDYGETLPHMVFETGMFDLDAELLGRLPFETADAGVSAVSGRAKLEGIVFAHINDNIAFSWNITTRLHDVSMMYTGMQINVNGSGRLQYKDDVLAGTLRLDAVTAGVLSMAEFSCDFDYTRSRLLLEDIRFSAYGGMFESSQTTVYTSDKTWNAQLDIQGVDLFLLLNSLGIMDEQVPEGILRASFELEGRAFDMQAITGAGKAEINDGKLYSFPILVAVLRLFDFKLPTQSPVTDAYGLFRIEDGVITVTDLLFTGGTIPIYMEGYVGLQNSVPLKDQSIFMLVTMARNESVLDRIPLVGTIKHYTIDFLRRLVFHARITGTLGDYRVTTISSPITGQLQKMWSFRENIRLGGAGD